MIITNLTGGLGNQMFQYALGRHLAIINNTELKLHFTNALFNTQREFELAIFNIKATIANDEDLKRMGVVKNQIINRVLYLVDERIGFNFNSKIVTQKFPYKFDSTVLDLKDNIYLQGYWADERYFSKIANTLRDDFTFIPKFDHKNLQTSNLITSNNSISIHVRRTDYVTNNRNYYKFIGLDYYSKSVKQVVKYIKDPVFFIFSDDIDWCRQNFKFPYKMHFIDQNYGKNAYKDMQLMSLCKHNIVANSTFSWWAGWLNNNKDKIVITPK